MRRGGRGKRGSRGILSQCAFAVVEFLPVVVSVALSLVVIRHRVLRYVSRRTEYLESKKQVKPSFADFCEGAI